ncbi:MAG: SRPBCC family protein [Acidimicrobiia bacterium]
MTSFTRTITIDAPTERVWTILADVGTIAEWNPGLTSSKLTSDEPTGPNASRHCDLKGGKYVEERVSEYEEGKLLTMEIYESNLPVLDSIAVRFQLESQEGTTTVNCSPNYTLKYGPLGTLADRLFIRRTYEKGMDGLLAGLKRHVENGG